MRTDRQPRAYLLPQPDRLEALAHVTLGLSAVMALGVFFSTMIQVTGSSPRIAQVAFHSTWATAPCAVAHQEGDGNGRTNGPAAVPVVIPHRASVPAVRAARSPFSS